MLGASGDLRQRVAGQPVDQGTQAGFGQHIVALVVFDEGICY
jgi:hypothetical protein